MERLAKCEKQILKLLAHGFKVSQIAVFRFRSVETIRKTIANIKIKLDLHSDNELVAFYWCQTFGRTLDQERELVLAELRQYKANLVIAGSLTLLILMTTSMDYDKRRGRTLRRRKEDIEVVNSYYPN